ncbi:MAG: hypothetical protein R3E39_31275 [Anaerolineae bacterium]
MHNTVRYLRLALYLILILCIPLIFIRTQPYDDHELRDLLLPPGCPAPCFMGIRPGVTTVDEAVKILEASGWVEDIQLNNLFYYVKWNNNSPTWLAGNLCGGSSIRVTSNLVDVFALDTSLSVREVQLILGRSPFQYVSVGEIEGRRY